MFSCRCPGQGLLKLSGALGLKRGRTLGMEGLRRRCLLQGNEPLGLHGDGLLVFLAQGVHLGNVFHLQGGEPLSKRSDLGHRFLALFAQGVHLRKVLLLCGPQLLNSALEFAPAASLCLAGALEFGHALGMRGVHSRCGILQLPYKGQLGYLREPTDLGRRLCIASQGPWSQRVRGARLQRRTIRRPAPHSLDHLLELGYTPGPHIRQLLRLQQLAAVCSVHGRGRLLQLRNLRDMLPLQVPHPVHHGGEVVTTWGGGLLGRH
mmetsp:Transcript_31968/g.68048  ORF Transcript_31968/g.68048 Transcript_31968/m.68048 type:complete len:263 (-) Transcript_31968:293-1081(-)